ncbi:MAG: NAD-dependent succinate-semialdehyde dehydrogenase [Acidimicrobiales bacterium]|nr:MAG: NAD-dependent succinate-semialdehyde dehydrogenase [Acidimicrobiales bacterium]
MQTKLVIGGERRDGSEGDTVDVLNPANGELVATVAAGSVDDMLAACDVASEAQKSWAATAPRVRAELLRGCYQVMIDNADALADIIVAEHGKPKADALGEIAYGAEFFRWNSEEAVRLQGTVGMNPAGNARMIVHHPPVGVVLMVTPWNFPAAMITRKIAPALAAGNACVIKPAKETPLTALALADLFENEVGLPAGLVNMVTTKSASKPVAAAMDHNAIRMVSFTGSTEVGRILLQQASGRVLKTAMELGGNAPFIVFADADLDAAVEGALAAKMRHSAETCTAANRFFVEESVMDEFGEKLAAAMGAMKVGDGTAEGTQVGPLINQDAVDNVDRLVTAAVAGGATALSGGSPMDGPGFFYPPTVLAGVSPANPITSEEIFGPVAPLIGFSDEDDMIAMANDTEMGLIGYVFTEDLAKGLRVSEQIQAGIIGLNRGVASDPAAPFGGMKQSGVGREGASEGIYEFCETQYIATNW